jgi:NAD(P)H-quinone oxidoreductase subunit 4
VLSFLIWMPVLGAVLLSLWPGKLSASRLRLVALMIMTVALVWTVVVGFAFAPSEAGLQLREQLPWLEGLGLSYRLSLDGLSFPLLVLNGLLTWLALYATETNIQRPRLYYAMMLLLNASVTGAFVAENLLLFFLFYELELIPLYLLISIWGGPRRGYAATKFLIYTAVSGVLLLGAFLGLTWLGGASSFDYQPLLTQALPVAQQCWLLAALLIGFGIKIPLVPFHTWLPDAHVEAGTPVSMLLAGVLLKLGTYGLIRYGMILLPQGWVALAPWLATWAVITTLYGALMAIAQTDMKRMVAFSSIAHMGYILLACAAATPLSLLGATFQMVSHGLISALLFMLVGVVYQKTGTRNIDVLRGLLNPERGLPIIGSMMVLGVMASSGMPGMAGFISEFLVFRGSFPVFPQQTLLSIIGTGLTAVYFLLLVNRVFFGRLSAEATDLPSVTWSDRFPGLILTGLIILLGLQPAWMLSWSESTTTALAAPLVRQFTTQATLVIPTSTSLSS